MSKADKMKAEHAARKKQASDVQFELKLAKAIKAVKDLQAIDPSTLDKIVKRVSAMPEEELHKRQEVEVFTKEPIEVHMTFRQKVGHSLKTIPDGLTPEQVTALERMGPLTV